MDEEEKDGLLIPTITTHGELDEFEQQNIEPAVRFKHWGATILTGDSDARAAYLKAAKAADMGDYSLLLAFAYS